VQSVTEILLGQHGVAGVQELLAGAEAQAILHAALTPQLAADGEPRACRLQRAKFKPGRKLVAYYDVAVRRAAPRDELTRPIAVTWSPVAGAGAPAWDLQIKVSPHDAAYPQLPRLVDPAYVRALLAAHVPQVAAEHAADSTVTTVRYRPGQRHVLRFSPAGSAAPNDVGGGGGPDGAGTVYAKLYAPAQYPAAEGQAFCALTRRLADWLEACVPGATVLRPAAYVAEDTTILYPWVEGVPLADLQRCCAGGERDQGAPRVLAATGAALAALHAAPPAVRGEPAPLPLAGEIAAIGRTCEHIQVLLPAVGRRIRALLAQAAAAYAALPQEDPTFIHGDFKADHVLVAPGPRLTLIDFDACGLGDPAYDTGKFLADLAWAYAACPPGDLVAARDAFLGGYGLPAGHSRLQRAQVVAALILVKIAAHRVKLFDPTWGAQTAALVEQAQALLV
jgi:aminoglycoside phosphotransferase (APT) family kinase protein